MQVDERHRLSGCTWSPSRHFDDRPLRQDIELIVLHCISLPEGKFGHGYPEQLFLGTLKTEDDPSFSDLEGLRVAPHLYIDRKGNATQFVSFDKRAWHAGVSSWRGRSNCNDFSIGIELEGCVDAIFEEAQYKCLRNLLSALFLRYDRLSLEAVVGHNEIASDRKTDPGKNFEWLKVFKL